MRKFGVLTAIFSSLVFFVGAVYAAPPTIFSTDEVSGTGAASRAAVDTLNDAWEAAVISTLGATASDFEVGSIATGTLPNVLAASNGLNVTVSLNDMTNFANTADFGVPANTQGSAGNATSSTMQDSSPKPDSIYITGSSAYYNEISGAASSRNGLVFDFSQPATNFGAWFGDVETRTKDGGVPAELRLYDAAGTLLSTQLIDPMPSDPAFDQTQCGAPVADTFRGCGNRTTRWIGFVADSTMPVSKMILIVGDDDTTAGSDDGNTEHMSFIGATMAVIPPEPEVGVSKLVASVTDNGAGLNTVTYNVTTTNTGNVNLDNFSLVDDLAATFNHPVATTISSPTVSVLTAPTLTTSSIATNPGYGIGDWETIAAGGNLDVGDSFTLEITVSVDIGTDTGAIGPYSNTAAATGTYGEGEDQIIVTDDSQDGAEYSPDEDDDPTNDNETTPVELVPGPIVDPPPPLFPGMTFIKMSSFSDEDGSGSASTGETIVYTFEVCNTGNTILTDITVADDLVAVAGEITSLDPGACDSTTFTATYIITAKDIAAGGVSNSATASGSSEGSETPIERTSDSGNPADDTGLNDDPTYQVLSAVEQLAETGSSATLIAVLVGFATLLTSSLLLVESTRKDD